MRILQLKLCLSWRVKNKTIIGLKLPSLTEGEGGSSVKNKTIIGLKSNLTVDWVDGVFVKNKTIIGLKLIYPKNP